jgi:GrpB-like predicted nucleotidyltransferase (UPF0157 family)
VIVIEQPNAGWPEEFRAIGATALRIDHIGSTAVAGLAAKDVIDVQVTIESFEQAIPLLVQAGFVLREHMHDHRPPGMRLPDTELEKRLFGPSSGRRANIHVRIVGRFNQRYALLCRDYLRTHPRAAAAYATIKQQLARYFPHDAEAYYNIKDPVFDLIMAGAEDWAQTTHWQPAPSDS